jgi:hypothetical protein
MEQLFRGYQFENFRGNKEEAHVTKTLITKELYRRLKYALDALDFAETEEEAIKLYNRFIVNN